MEVVEQEQVVRSRVRYRIEPDCWAEAYVLKPIYQRGRLPGVIAFHSTVPETMRQPAGIEGEPEKAFGLRLAQQGYVALCPRCFLWDDGHRHFFSWHARRQVRKLQRRHPGARGMAKMLHDARVGLDVLASLPEVDEARLGAVGHSLGAKQVLYLTAFDERVRVAVSSEGGIGRSFSNWSAPWYLGKDRCVEDAERDHHELLALIAPRAFLLIGGDSADGEHSRPFIDATLPVYRLYDQPPRIELFNHQKGHTVPPEAERRIYDWFDAYL
nr:dienelactone hydrolase family protein [Rhodopirellula sp. JC639]